MALANLESRTPNPGAYRGRFAPSPTGALHFGSLVAAVGSWLRARAAGGTWIIRMEDIDPSREVPGAAADILATLAAFGMESDEPVLYQSQREAAYRSAFERLRAEGYPCWCSRSDLDPFQGLHPATCVAAAEPDRAPAWRLRVPDIEIVFDDVALGVQRQNLRREVGDFVILRADGWFAYQLAVVVDDAHQGITEVVRGADLLDSTPRQIYLQQLLALPTPAHVHLPLVVDADGSKLSKQDRARPVDRADPVPALRAALAFLGCRPHGVAARVDSLLDAAVPRFDRQRLHFGARAAPQRGSP